MGKMSEQLIYDQDKLFGIENKQGELQKILSNSETFDEFFKNAEDEITEHLVKIKHDRNLFCDEVEDYAKELWDEYVNSTMPF